MYAILSILLDAVSNCIVCSPVVAMFNLLNTVEPLVLRILKSRSDVVIFVIVKVA